MTVIGPYRLLRTLGSCEAGKVWSAFSADGTSVTIAMIEPARAADPRWLNALMSGADGLARAGVLMVVGADLSPPQPWVACAWDEGIGAGRLFTAGGLTYQLAAPGGRAFPPEPVPVYRPSSAQPAAEPMEQFIGQPPAQTIGQPAAPPFVPAQPGPIPNGAPSRTDPGDSTFGLAQVAPQPVFPVDSPTAELRQVPAAQPLAPLPPSQVLPEFAPPSGPAPARPTAPTPKTKPGKAPREPRRRGRAVLLTLLVLLLVGGAGAFAVWRYGPLDKLLGQVTGAPTTSTPTEASPVTGPGIEPPVAGDWPASWPTFTDTDQVKSMNLDGVGFTIRVPATWNCTKRVGGLNGVGYNCGTSSGVTVGGEFDVHPCDDGCDADQRERLRRPENAWGLQWTRAGAYVTWAQTSALPAPAQYGLIVIGYWRNKPDGPINRQVVLRLTGPKNQAADLQKVANDVFAKIS